MGFNHFCAINFYRKKLEHPGLFPVKLICDELEWKITLDFDVQKDSFILSINDQAFLTLPYQAHVMVDGPQNIEKGEIRLNEVVVNTDFKQYT